MNMGRASVDRERFRIECYARPHGWHLYGFCDRLDGPRGALYETAELARLGQDSRIVDRVGSLCHYVDACLPFEQVRVNEDLVRDVLPPVASEAVRS